jgi:hypothetical protein
MCGTQSLKSRPALPYFLNFRLLARRLFPPVPIGVMTLPKLAGSGWPCRFVSSGFGSVRSTWLGPPSMNRKMTDFAFAGKCGVLGASGSVGSGERGASAPRVSSADSAESARAPNPPPARRRKSRRERNSGTC